MKVLREYLLQSEDWKQLSLNVFRSYTFEIMYYDTDLYGFETYVISDKKYGVCGVLYKGKVLSIAHFEVILTFIKESYKLSDREIEILKEYGNQDGD